MALDSAPGGVSLLDRQQLQQLSPSTSTHDFGVAQAIDLAEQLDQLPDRLQLVGIHMGTDTSMPPPLDTGALEGLIRTLL